MIKATELRIGNWVIGVIGGPMQILRGFQIDDFLHRVFCY
jgi:hypothetical protein